MQTHMHVHTNTPQVVRAPAAQAGGPGFDPRRLPCLFFFSLPAGLDKMKDLWCSSIVWLLLTQT